MSSSKRITHVLSQLALLSTLLSVSSVVAAQTPFTVPGSLSTTTVIHSFGYTSLSVPENTDGFGFNAPLTLGSDGNLYGITTQGGPNGTGMVFRTTTSGQTTILFAFAAVTGGTKGITEESGGTNVTGAYPEGPLVEDPSSSLTFYGTASAGGQNGQGVIFKLSVSGNSYTQTVLHNFADPATPNDGAQPVGSLVINGGILYGTTFSGGPDESDFQGGTAYSIATSGTGYAIIHGFNQPGETAGGPIGLIFTNALYGVAGQTVYSLNTDGAGYVEIQTFDTGTIPNPYLSTDQAGDIYGSFYDGASGVFEISAAGAYSVIHMFARSTEGSDPGPPTVGSDGNLYGVIRPPTGSAGTALFEMSTLDGSVTLLNGLPILDESALNTTDQALAPTYFPIGIAAAPLAASPDGSLYGVENANGAATQGDIYQVRPTPGQTFMVTSTADDANSEQDPTTLRGALAAAEDDPPGDAIVFSPQLESSQNTITLTQGEFDITQDVNIVFTPATSTASLTIDANQNSRIFEVDAGVVNLTGLNLQYGNVQPISIQPTAIRRTRTGKAQPRDGTSAEGGGVLVDGGAVALNDDAIYACTVGQGTSGPGEGGGVCLSAGYLTLQEQTSVTSCSAPNGGGLAIDTGTTNGALGSPVPGGALINMASIQACDAMEGGGLYINASGPVGIVVGNVSNNQSVDNGGGIYNGGGLQGEGANSTLIGSFWVDGQTEINNNVADGVTIQAGSASPIMSSGTGSGGGIYNFGSEETILDSVISGNQAVAGGAIFALSSDGANNNDFDDLDTFSSNAATAAGQGDQFDGDGGAITVNGGKFKLLRSTIGGPNMEEEAIARGGHGIGANGPNFATNDGGGVYLAGGTMSLDDVTIFGNSALADGGGVFNAAIATAALSMTYCTVADNDAIDLGGGLYEDLDGEGDTFNPFNVESSIIAQNTLDGSTDPAAGQDIYSVMGATFASGGSNLIGNGLGGAEFVNDPDASDPDSAGNHDQVGNLGGGPVIDPNLGALQNNGGIPDTMALLHGSPALGGSFNTNVNIDSDDERLVDRFSLGAPFSANWDIGAFNHETPFSGNAYYTTPENTPLSVAAPGLMNPSYTAGDEDTADFSPIMSALVTQASHGTATVNTDGSFTYTPVSGYFGTDTFTFDVFDQDTSSVPYTATITVTPTGGGPTTTATLSPVSPNGTNGWYTVPVTVTLTATDANYGADQISTFYTVDGGPLQTYFAPGPDSGQPIGTGAFTVSGDGIHTITFYSSDPGGNTESPVNTLTIQIDGTPPTTTANTQSETDGEQVTLNAADATSGVASTTYTIDGSDNQTYEGPFLISTTGSHTVTYYSTDVAGNVEATHTLTVTVTLGTPITTATLSPTSPNGTNGWYDTPVTVTLTASISEPTQEDARQSHSAGITTYYSVDGGAQQTYTGPFSVSGDANHTISFYSTAPFTNPESPNTTSFKIDTTPPVTTAALSGPGQPAARTGTARKSADRKGAVQSVYGGPATVTLTATDNLSGVASTTYAIDGGANQTYAGPFVVSAPGNHTVTFYSTDKAGNVESPKSTSFSIVNQTAKPGNLHGFGAGLYLFSAPRDMSGIPLSTVFDQPISKLAVWLPQMVAYVLSPTAPADAIRPGQGYWGQFSVATNLLDMGAATPNAPFAIPIHVGWNMVGDPFPTAEGPANIQIKTSTGTFALSSSIGETLIYGTFFSYDTPSGQYVTHNLVTDSWTPYVGYWIYSRCEADLVVTP